MGRVVDEDDVFDYIIENEISDISISSLKAVFKNVGGLDTANLEEKLATYEDLDEQGLLLRLPCKVGDTIYKCDDDTHKIFPMVVKDISPYGTLRQCKSGDCSWNIYAESDYTYTYKSFYDLGKSVFLTKSEAEQTLKRMEGEKLNV